ncbi:SGNH/GDSL hydrolase family protein [Flavobacterium sp. 5]|uniref:SGNH/GDSL hydrolase family protein n=1 Tax=Flavobacterium sp. 5 TaxID=2035199 RepID=UPI000C2BABE6|nr:SGNH/GDSL hydrolase family protein [Flavobacterium sp. 5]PKB15407.1 lysophospholipase L1-like esterase [Flavobacterium sp. 5]
MAFSKSKIKSLFAFIMDGKIKVPDWGYLSRYKDENAQITALPFEEKRVVFFGDSITAGWMTYDPKLFGNKKNINRGINGQTTSQMLIRFKQDVIELKPETVIILAGTNDIAGNTGLITIENILENLKSMCELSKANSIKTVLCSILPAFDYPWRKGMQPAEKIETLNTMIRQYALENNIVYVDYYSAMADEQKGLKVIYSDDGVHPNKEGYQIMKSILDSTI